MYEHHERLSAHALMHTYYGHNRDYDHVLIFFLKLHPRKLFMRNYQKDKVIKNNEFFLFYSVFEMVVVYKS